VARVTFNAFQIAAGHPRDVTQRDVVVKDAMHGFVAMGGIHVSFRDPFVYLLHSNVDTLFGRWQTEPRTPR
jgi:hypothetical protein